MVLRPDEEAAQAKERRAKSVLQTVQGVGLSAAGGIAASKVMPFLNEYIPKELAVKGINKVFPKLGEILMKGQKLGMDVKEGLDFIKSKMPQEGQKTAKQGKNLIEEESPELHQFLDQEIRKGRNPIEAAVLAQHDKKFTETIKKLMKKHKVGWSDIIQSIYGAGDMGLPQQQPSGNAEQMGQQQQQQGGGLDPGVAQILQQGQALLQKFKGQP